MESVEQLTIKLVNRNLELWRTRRGPWKVQWDNLVAGLDTSPKSTPWEGKNSSKKDRLAWNLTAAGFRLSST